MESWLELARREAREAKPRARDVKGHGIHYTPRELADFLARRIVAQLELTTPQIAVLDPASGFLLVLREGSRDLRRRPGPSSPRRSCRRSAAPRSAQSSATPT